MPDLHLLRKRKLAEGKKKESRGKLNARKISTVSLSLSLSLSLSRLLTVKRKSLHNLRLGMHNDDETWLSRLLGFVKIRPPTDLAASAVLTDFP